MPFCLRYVPADPLTPSGMRIASSFDSEALFDDEVEVSVSVQSYIGLPCYEVENIN